VRTHLPFPPDILLGKIPHAQVAMTVISYNVSAARYLSHQLGMRCGVHAHQKECGSNVISVEDGQEALCINGIGAVVEGESYDLGPTVTMSYQRRSSLSPIINGVKQTKQTQYQHIRKANLKVDQRGTSL
jgi:uncharacterized Zn-binding protein involved in type VI secretion